MIMIGPFCRRSLSNVTTAVMLLLIIGIHICNNHDNYNDNTYIHI